MKKEILTLLISVSYKVFGMETYPNLAGFIDLKLEGTGTGNGFMNSSFEKTEPYVLGSLTLNNCQFKRSFR